MLFFIAIQSTYTQLEIGLYQDNKRVAYTAIDKALATKDSIAALDKLLHCNQISLSDIAFFTANQGPGPFTTLRVAISMVNGLAFATKIPLIGIDGLYGFLDEYSAHSKAIVVVLNAFGNDVYYGIQTSTLGPITGLASAKDIVSAIIQKIPNEPILFLGNGIPASLTAIKATFEDRALFLNPSPQTVSLDHLAHMAFTQWNKQENITHQIQPSYYKSAFIN